eukprot:CCRYP_014241-RA/>CCRYP_014241-RA protein AED:0.07 eAED:0.21 QI:0/0/0/1/1/1/2/0/996
MSLLRPITMRLSPVKKQQQQQESTHDNDSNNDRNNNNDTSMPESTTTTKTATTAVPPRSTRNKKHPNDKDDHDDNDSLWITSSTESSATTAVMAGAGRWRRRRSGGGGSGNLLSNRSASTATAALAFEAMNHNHHNGDNNDNDDGMHSEQDEQDPLLALFRVHNSHRVKFDLSPRGRREEEEDHHQHDNDNDGDGKRKELKFNIKKFVQSSLFHHGNGSAVTASTSLSSSTSTLSSSSSCLIHSKASLDQEEELIMNKLLLGGRKQSLSSLGRVTSFLKSVRGSHGGSSAVAYHDFLEEDEEGQGAQHAIHTTNDSVDDNDVRPGKEPMHSSLSSSSSPSSSLSTSKERMGMYLRKAKRAHRITHRYRLAMKYYLLTLKEYQLYTNETNGNNPTRPPKINNKIKNKNNNNNATNDAFTTHILKCLNDVHHAQTTLNNSASIVEMGIRHEDRKEYVKALKMYTVAYRMRRDSLGEAHASLPVLLNMMGSVQIKRGEYEEALEIYELGLKRRGRRGGRKQNEEEEEEENGEEVEQSSEEQTNGVFYNMNPLTTSVTLRDMGMIFEHLGKEEKALRFYHASLKYAVKYLKQREVALAKMNVRKLSLGGGGGDDSSRGTGGDGIGNDGKEFSSDQDSSTDSFLENIDAHVDEPFSLEEVRIVKSTSIDKSLTKPVSSKKGEPPSVVTECESGEMELFLEKRFDRWAFSQEVAKSKSAKFYYDDLFVGPPQAAAPAAESDAARRIGNGEGADVDIAMTLHQIGQIHRRSHRYAAALSAYNASLRGMKQVFGSEHAHIAAILGNIGNLYMETGDNDEAFAIYQEVLGIETLHLGLSHPEVAVTLHNIATIECSRGNFAEGISLYKQVVEMQKIRFGHNHITVAVTLGCLADAYERMGNLENAMKIYEEALAIRMGVLTKYHLDVGRLMHKLGRLAASRQDYSTAMGHVKKAIEIYALNELPSNHLFMREMARDYADIRAGLAFGTVWPYFHLDDNIDAIFDC